jgi:hypothetical protein
MATRGARDPGGNSVSANPAAPAPVAHTAAPSKTGGKATAHKAVTPKIQTKPQVAQAPRLTASERTAVKVKAALAKGDAVVFLFTHAGAADDTATRAAVRTVQNSPHVTVVRAGLKDLTAFRPVLSGAGVSQVPAVVVAHAGKPARLIEGYVDSGTLRQTVADALR